MPHKIPFSVCHVSGQSESHPAVELNNHTPTSVGWQSSKFCLFPQDIVIQTDYKVRLTKIQILSHQYLISTKIEFFVGDVVEGDPLHPENAKYTRLGYVSLSDNEKTNFKARELKSVHVDAVGQFLKLVIHKNHINKHNLYNQVGIVAINVIGVDANSNQLDTSGDPDIANLFNKADYISPLDDLAFDMYQDPEVAQIIRKLEKKKKTAVTHENFELAKKLKLAIEELQKVGERLGKYELEKRHAVENEDYDTAKIKRDQMENYRLQIYQQLEIHHLLDVAPGKKYDPMEPFTRDKNRKKNYAAVQRNLDDSPPGPDSRSLNYPSVSQRSYYNDYENQPIPTLRGKKSTEEGLKDVDISPHTSGEYDERDNDGALTGTGEPDELSQLSEKDMREAQPIVDAFGQYLAAKAFSKNWSHREDAVTHVYKELSHASSSQETAQIMLNLRAAIQVVRKTLPDKVASVFKASTNLLEMIFTEYIPKMNIPRTDSVQALERVLPLLLQKLGDTNTRLREIAKDFLLTFCTKPEVVALNVIPVECVRPIKPNAAPKLAYSRFEVVDTMYSTFGLSKGLTLDGLMNFCVVGLDHPAGEVRAIAERLVVNLYRDHDKERIRSFLPPDDEHTRRQPKYRMLFDAFDQIDGKQPIVGSRGIPDGGYEAEQRKREEIQGLQQELKQLRDLRVEKEQTKDNHIRKKQDLRSQQTSEPLGEKNSNEIPLEAIDHMCIFCNEKNPSFNEQGLDLHYWKKCPMLKRCEFCRQVVEIQSLTEHLLTECEARVKFARCPQCGEAIPTKELDGHISENSCNIPGINQGHCPLCHLNFPGTEDGWRAHLMRVDGCRNNPRRTTAKGFKAGRITVRQ